MSLLVTGGTGMVGSAFKALIPDADYPTREEFHNNFYDMQGKNVVHLAAKVGGVKANTDEVCQFYTINSTINQKLLHQAYSSNAKKVVSLLSTIL